MANSNAISQKQKEVVRKNEVKMLWEKPKGRQIIDKLEILLMIWSYRSFIFLFFGLV